MRFLARDPMRFFQVKNKKIKNIKSTGKSISGRGGEEGGIKELQDHLEFVLTSSSNSILAL